MNAISRFTMLCIAITTALALSACGGGSGGGGMVKPPPPPPTPAVIGVIEDARSDHIDDVTAVAEQTAGEAGDVRQTHIAFELGTTPERTLRNLGQLLLGIPVSENPSTEELRERLASYDITNGSYSLNVWPEAVAELGAPLRTNLYWTTSVYELFQGIKDTAPEAWNVLAQVEVPDHEKTIRVWAAGNERQPTGAQNEDGNVVRFGDQALNEHLLKVYAFPEFWGHEVIATALTNNESTIADYANYCGPVPDQWNAAAHGRHFCIAASGDTLDGEPGGTSLAAPRVAGVLARMHVASRETMRGSHLVKRLMDTADNTGEFANSDVYGAGRMNADRALSPQGALSYASASGRSHSASTTSVTLPTAYGDAAASLAQSEVMAWDEDLFPFWIPTGSIVHAAERNRSPIPTFDDEAAGAATCALSANLTGGANCFGAEKSPWSTIVAEHGGGTSYALNGWSQINAFARFDGRLDGAGKGGLALTQHSTLLGATLHKDWEIRSGTTRVKAGTRMSLVVDAPWETSAGADTMLDIGTTVLSSAEANVTVAREGGATTLKVEQPPRAETGTGRLSLPYTRTLDGEPRFEHREFALAPSERELTASLRHERDDIAGGRLAVMVSHTMNPGHTNEGPDNAIGIAWRMSW